MRHDIMALLLLNAIKGDGWFSRSKDLWQHKKVLMATKEKRNLLKSLNYYRQEY
jgi:hypothetical protein